MMEIKCPGQDDRFWDADAIAELDCPDCGQSMEFWPDEVLRKCRGCGRRLSNPKFNMGCLEWCRYATQCLDRIRGAKDAAARPVREELQEIVRGIFAGDDHRIEHAERVLELSEQIGRAEGADPLVLVPAALLHDIGLAGTEVDSDTPAVRAHGPRGAERAAEVLRELSFPKRVVDEVAGIIAHHHDSGAMEGASARSLCDADLIVNLRELPRDEALRRLKQEALTERGVLVGESYLADRAPEVDRAEPAEP
ncbi:MAG: HD domain-containing protein [Candidatus Brocadiia bacterium]|jgi:putative nucleotidyltransferase with HDIG domain|nr:HD domain-containing protein [Candidatus Brocadiia bacterium]